MTHQKKGLSLIVGLGNPGKKYEKTRHNLGSIVVRGFADTNGWLFKKEKAFEGELALGSYLTERVALLLPTTYMNRSGQSVRKVFDFYKTDLEDLLVVTDDIYLPFGTLRFREKGSAGGHNGLKDIEENLQTQEYPRLRIGIGDRREGLLEDYVLSGFLEDESSQLPAVIQNSIALIEKWLKQEKEIYEQTK